MVAGGGPPGDLVLLGRVTGSWGVRGALRLHPETDFPERIPAREWLTLWRADLGARRHRVTGGRLLGRGVLVSLEGVATPEDAQALKGALVMVPEGDVTPLPEGRYYAHHLVGARVERPDGRQLGTIREVVTGGPQDLWVVACGEREFMLPAVQAFVRRVDPAAGLVVADPPPGLEETG